MSKPTAPARRSQRTRPTLSVIRTADLPNSVDESTTAQLAKRESVLLVASEHVVWPIVAAPGDVLALWPSHRVAQRLRHTGGDWLVLGSVPWAPDWARVQAMRTVLPPVDVEYAVRLSRHLIDEHRRAPW